MRLTIVEGGCANRIPSRAGISRTVVAPLMLELFRQGSVTGISPDETALA